MGRPRKHRPEIENIQTAGEFLEGAGVREVNRTIRRTFQVEVPIEQPDSLTATADDDYIADNESDLLPEPAAVSDAPDWMDSLWDEVGGRGPNFTMIIYRLPEYDKDKRHDRGARRINCGTRPFTPDFEEDIRREFARPGLVNHFTLTIRADGKFYKNWPGVISLEPPPPEIIQQEILKQQTIASVGSPQPANTVMLQQQPGTSLGDAIKYLRELNELQDSITPPWVRELMKRPPQFDQPQSVTPSGEITTEQALFKLATQDPDVVEKLSERLLGRALNENPPEETWAKTLAPVVAQIAPSVISILAGLAQRFLMPGQAAPMAETEQPQPAQIQTAQPVSREQELFQIVLSDMQARKPAQITARRLMGFTDAFPEVAQWLDVLAQTPATQLLAQTASVVPEAAALTAQPESLHWLQSLQTELNRDEQDDQEASGNE